MACYGMNVGETETTSPVEPSSKSARRRRMEIHQFKFVPNDAAVAPPLEKSKKRRRMLESVIPISLPQQCTNAADPVTKLVDVSASPSSSRVESDVIPEFPKFGMTSVCGRRRDMEDAVSIHPSFCGKNHNSPSGLHFFGLYDGHGCSHVATKCKDRMHEIVRDEVESGEASWAEMMTRSFSKMDREITNRSSGTATCRCELQTPQCDAVGSTAVVAVLSAETIIVSNCGDSRAVLCRNGVSIPLSTDHKPDRPDELNRIEEAGGRVIFWDGPRVLGVLAMSRAIGDNYLKPYVISEPEVTITDRTAEDECLILASDGLWDVVSNETACRVARMCLQSRKLQSPACSGGIVESSKSVDVEHEKTLGFSGKLKSTGSFGKLKNDNASTYPDNADDFEKAPHNLYDSGELNLSISQELKPSTPARKPANKAPQVSSFLGKAGIVGLEKAVEVLDTLGSSMTNLNSGGFASGVSSRGNKISILAFEVANTIAKGANLMQSLSEENIQFLLKEVLHSEGVQKLVSTDMNELLRIAAADKREEFDVLSREVIRFGNLCKDAQFHNLNRFFSKLDSDPDVHKQLREEAKTTIQELTSLAQHTSELYHELHAMDRFEQDYRRQVEEVDSLHLPRKGESLVMLHSELKHQRKLVRSLKKKSLWSKSLKEVVEKLVDVVTFIHQDILESFGDNGLMSSTKESTNKPERLGVAGLSLHYANIITQIDNIASRPTALPSNMRDTLYNGLPPTVKNALRSRLQIIDTEEQLTAPQIKAEMEKTLQWLVPLATDTTKAHQGFGWVGEWAHAGNEFGKRTGTPNNLIRLQTLYHADKQKADSYILELVTWLHRLVSLVTYRDNGLKAQHSTSPILKTSNALSSNNNVATHNVQLSSDDKSLLDKVVKRKNLALGLSKSQEFTTVKNGKNKVWAFSRSTGSSPRRGLEHLKGNVLDILDGLDSAFLAPREDVR